jgi:hypothetical protein
VRPNIDQHSTGSFLVNRLTTETSRRDPFQVLRPLARAAWRWSVYLAVSIAIILVILGLSVTAFGVGAGRGVSLLWFWPGAVAFLMAAIAGGDVFRAARRLVARLVNRRGARTADAGTDSTSDANPELISPVQSKAEARGSWKLALLRRRWRSILALTMFLPVTAFGLGIFAGRLLDDELAKAMADADRDDPFWRLDDLIDHRDEIPDEENSALVVSEALSLLPGLPWPPARVPAGNPSEADDNATLEFFEQMIATPANFRLDSDVVDAMRGELQEYRGAVKMLRTVADFARGRHEVEIGPTILDTLLEETQASRSAGRLLAADAAIRAHVGDYDGALDSSRAEIGVARSIGDEPFMISQLVRFAIGSQALQMARRVLAQGEPSDPALAKLQELILDELRQPLMLHAARGERAMHIELFRQMATGELDSVAFAGGKPTPMSERTRLEHPSWTRCYFDLQVGIAMRWMNDAVAIEQRSPAPARPALWKVWEANLYATKQSRLGRLYAWLPLLMFPALRPGATAFETYQSELGATVILLAAERHRRVKGAWPTSIEAIERNVLLTVPVDPFTGQPFRMEQRDGQLFVYSIGPNGIDEHGAYDSKAHSHESPDDFGGSLWDLKMRGEPANEAMRKDR